MKKKNKKKKTTDERVKEILSKPSHELRQKEFFNQLQNILK
jgi:hypothetical protein